MKLLFRLAVLVPFAVLVCTGCTARKAEAFEPVREGSYGFTLTSADFTCAGRLTVNGPELYKISFDSPVQLTDLLLETEESGFRVYFGDFQTVLPLHALPDNAAVKLTVQALDFFLYHRLSCEKTEDGQFLAEGDPGGYAASAVFDAEGYLRHVRIDACDWALLLEPETS